MRSDDIPFKFDMTDIVARARRQVQERLSGVTISLPFVSLAVSLKDRERAAAQEIVIRLRDRRVLSAWECCDDCIDKSLASLREIRQVIVDKQVELSNLQDGALFLLLDAMGAEIRQFMTFAELLEQANHVGPHPHFRDFRRPHDKRQAYFDGLEVLRGHLSRCLGQIATIAGTPIPENGLIKNYQGSWQLGAYISPPES